MFAGEISLVGPEALLLLGATPAKAMIKKSFTLGSERGVWFDTEAGYPALATYHPAYLLRLRGAGSGDYEQTRQRALEDLPTAEERAGGGE